MIGEPNGEASERPTFIRKVIPELALILAIVLLTCLAVAITWNPRQVDQRLLGTWLSDADRTIPLILGEPPYGKTESEKEAKLRKIYGKLRLTFTTTTCTSEFDGHVESQQYEVLGRDKASVAIRYIKPQADSQPDPLDFLELSSFQIVRFKGKGFLTVHSEAGGTDEIFKRIK